MSRCRLGAIRAVVALCAGVGVVLSSRGEAQENAGATAAVEPAAPMSRATPATEPIAPTFGEPILDDTTVAQPAAPRNWIDNLPYRPIPPLGNFPILPTGPGYYSLLDWLRGNYRQGPPKSAYPPYALMRNSMYDADWRYLDDPDYVSDNYFDRFHNVHLGDNWLFNTGGQMDSRYMHQDNARLTGNLDAFDLLRARIYGDVWYKDILRFYAEFIVAGSYNQELAPLKIDNVGPDFLNLFVGVKVAEFDDHPAYLRIGRQELLFGSERLVTPLEWANTRQTFQGVHGLWSNGTWDVDLFWAQYVLPKPTGWSTADTDQNFSGAWVTYHPNPKQEVDLYWLWLDDTDKVVSTGLKLDPTNVHTFGMRYVGDKNGFLWDVEPDLQIGQHQSQDILAGAVSSGLGYSLPKVPLQPTFWAYYDWASGNQHPGKGDYGTFNQLYGFGHYYLGFMDLIGRQNIREALSQG